MERGVTVHSCARKRRTTSGANQSSRGPSTTATSVTSSAAGSRGPGSGSTAAAASRARPDPDDVAGLQPPGPDPGEQVGGEAAQHRLAGDAAGHRQVGQHPAVRHPQTQLRTAVQGERPTGPDLGLLAVHDHEERGGRAGHGDDDVGERPDPEPAAGHLEGGGARGVAHQPVRPAQRPPVDGTGPRHALRRPAGTTQVGDHAQRAGGEHLQGGAAHRRRRRSGRGPRTPSASGPASTNRTRVPGESRAGSGRRASHSDRPVRPISCHPPGLARG